MTCGRQLNRWLKCCSTFVLRDLDVNSAFNEKPSNIYIRCFAVLLMFNVSRLMSVQYTDPRAFRSDFRSNPWDASGRISSPDACLWTSCSLMLTVIDSSEGFLCVADLGNITDDTVWRRFVNQSVTHRRLTDRRPRAVKDTRVKTHRRRRMLYASSADTLDCSDWSVDAQHSDWRWTFCVVYCPRGFTSRCSSSSWTVNGSRAE